MSVAAEGRFEAIYRSILTADVQRQLRLPHVPVSERDLAYALSIATMLSLAPDGDNDEASAMAIRKAYDVGIRSLGLAEGAKSLALEASHLILTRLGNFPARALLKNDLDQVEGSDPFIKAESIIREGENRLRGSDSDILLTDFQARLIRAFDAKRRVSVSAPTSAGKSFLLEVEILRRLRHEGRFVSAYLVPTRALIRQVMFDLSTLLRNHAIEHVSILTSPTVLPDTNNSNTKVVYVLTQERLASLLSADKVNSLSIDMIIVDEAHEISEASRGVTLERALSVALRRFPEARLFFSSPLRSNPEFLLDLFAMRADSFHFVEIASPIAQNIIKVYPIKGKTTQAKIELAAETDNLQLGIVDLGFRFRGRYMANIAAFFTATDENSIIYCNEPSESEKTAREIGEQVPESSQDEDLIDFAKFLSQEIHPAYRLASAVRKGVAFHYGNIPQIIRGRIEDLLRERKLRFVCCTSTLLQGMNLPAKNIFVEDPKKGRGKPMQPGDFWNLVGRAGRLSKEFQGNVFCIFGKQWDTDVTATKLVKIESAFENALQLRAPELLQAVRVPAESTEAPESAWAEQAYARIFSEYVSNGEILAESRRQQLPEFAEIDLLSKTLERTLPDDLFVDNYYLHPARLEELAARFRQYTNLLELIPTKPGTPGSYDRLETSYRIINEAFIRSPFQQYKYHAFLSGKWMEGKSLRDIIADSIAFKNVEGADAINDLIRELFADIEQQLRYKYVKYMRIYLDVLRVILIERGLEERSERLLPIHLFLEYGASSRTLINLMSIGLSRTSALLVQSQIGMSDDLDVIACQGYLDRVNLDLSNLPVVCKAEVARLRRAKNQLEASHVIPSS